LQKWTTVHNGKPKERAATTVNWEKKEKKNGMLQGTRLPRGVGGAQKKEKTAKGENRGFRKMKRGKDLYQKKTRGSECHLEPNG